MLGKQAKDKLTGVEGIITGRSEFLTGSPLIQLTLKLSTGEMSCEWIDEERIEIIGEVPAKSEEAPQEEIESSDEREASDTSTDTAAPAEEPVSASTDEALQDEMPEAFPEVTEGKEAEASQIAEEVQKADETKQEEA